MLSIPRSLSEIFDLVSSTLSPSSSPTLFHPLGEFLTRTSKGSGTEQNWFNIMVKILPN